MTPTRLVILMGTSGSGKTAIAEAIKTGCPELAEVRHFDSIGVPSREARLTWGPDGAWQRAMTLTWMATIAAMRVEHRPVLFEGQMRLAFVREGLLAAGIADARVILVDCDDATGVSPNWRARTMMMWAAFLRQEAKELGCEVLDTSELSLGYSVEKVCAHLAF